MQPVATLSDSALLHELDVIVGSHQHTTAQLILHLGELDVRRLHVDKGFPSLFAYCVELLCFSEDEACRRIEAARLARRFPAIYALLETGAVSLTVLGLLKPHLTEDNHQELLAGVSASSVRHAKEWLAARFPQPDVPWSIRKRPESRAIDTSPVSARVGPAEARVGTHHGPLASAHAGTLHGPLASAHAGTLHGPLASVHAGTLHGPLASARSRVEPLSRGRFLVKFTASGAMRDKLECATDLMRHANPSGELSTVLERALDLLITELEKKKQGRTKRPQKKPRSAKRSHVSRAARREVVERDGWRCSFVAESGRRCEARGFLEFDHETPRGSGGSSAANNLRILCRTHNRWAAERVYGKAHVLRAISASGMRGT